MKIRNLWFSTEHYHLNKGSRSFCIFPCLSITSFVPPFSLDLTLGSTHQQALNFSLFLYPHHSILLCLSHVHWPTVTQPGSPRFPWKWLQLNIQSLLWALFNLNSWMLEPFPSPTWVFPVSKMLSNYLCAKALHRKTFHRVLSCHHSERGAGKTHGWDTNTSQSRSLGQIQNAFSSCYLKGMKTT